MTMAKKKKIDPVQVIQVAAAAMTGASETDIGEAIGMSRDQVSRLMRKSEYKEAEAALADTGVQTAVRAYNAKMGALMEKALDVIEGHLNEHSLEAATLVVRTAGLLDKQKTQAQDTAIHIILPSYPPLSSITTDAADAVPGVEPSQLPFNFGDSSQPPRPLPEATRITNGLGEAVADYVWPEIAGGPDEGQPGGP